MKVALVHDWLTGMRGGERVLEALCQMYPDAPIFTLFHFVGSTSPDIERHSIYPSFLQKLPKVRSYYQYTYPLMPVAIEDFDLSGFDLVISTSHRIAKGILVSPYTCHISYIHTPMRDAWELSKEYFGKDQMSWWKRLVIPPQLSFLRVWDVISTARVDYMVANSQNVRQRIRHTYRRDATVIYPPVDTTQYRLAEKKGDYYLIVGSLEPNKRVHLAIEACNQLGVPLKIVGNTGRGRNKLMRQAKGNIEFLGWQDDDAVARLYSGAKAFLFPGIDDFGITPLEAQASGTPVVAFAAGGALETVIDGKTGVLFGQASVESMVEAIKRVDTIVWDTQVMQDNAQRFTKERFITSMKDFIETSYTAFRQTYA